LDKIIIKTEYWNGDKLVSKHEGAIDITDKTLVQSCELVKDLFINNISNSITEYLTK